MNLLKIIVLDKKGNETLRVFITEEEYQYIFSLNENRWGNIEDYKTYWLDDLKVGSFVVHQADKNAYLKIMELVRKKQTSINKSIEEVLK